MGFGLFKKIGFLDMSVVWGMFGDALWFWPATQSTVQFRFLEDFVAFAREHKL